MSPGRVKITDTIRDTVKNSLFVRVNASRLGGIVSLNRQEQDFINKWEAEAFRKNLAAGSVQGELQGRIAVVTGAGSGLGRSIAIGLAKAGAMVALVDIDKKEAQENRQKQIRNFQTMAVQCDVTNETSVDKAFEALLKEWGGLDILVNAAGVAPPYGLDRYAGGQMAACARCEPDGLFSYGQGGCKNNDSAGNGRQHYQSKLEIRS